MYMIDISNEYDFYINNSIINKSIYEKEIINIRTICENEQSKYYYNYIHEIIVEYYENVISFFIKCADLHYKNNIDMTLNNRNETIINYIIKFFITKGANKSLLNFKIGINKNSIRPLNLYSALCLYGIIPDDDFNEFDINYDIAYIQFQTRSFNIICCIFTNLFALDMKNQINKILTRNIDKKIFIKKLE